MEIYESYKPSGVEWIGDIPSHWQTASLRWLSKIYSGGTPDRNNTDYWTNGTIPWLNSGTVNDFVISQPSEFITQAAFENSSAKWIEAGSIVIALAGQGKTKGMSAIVTFPTTCNQSLGVISPSEKVHSKYLLYFLTRNYFHIRGLAGEGIRDGLNLEVIGSLTVPFFKGKEQERIASYLDRKTEEINKLIANKQKLIGLLKEERTAIINQAVTKGINPDVQLKPSGIDGLGDIPEHWGILPLKRLANRIEVGIAEAATHAYQDDGIPILRATNVKNGKIEGNLLYINPQFADKNKSKTIFSNDLVTVRTGNAGLTSVVPDYLNGCQCFTMLITTLENSNPFYFNYLLNSKYGETYFDITAWGTAQKNISVPILQRLPVPRIPVAEQAAIVAYLDEKSESTNKTSERIKDEIGLLNEYRIALISEAVTGKIRVV